MPDEMPDEIRDVPQVAAPGATPGATPGAAPGATPGAAPGAAPGATRGTTQPRRSPGTMLILVAVLVALAICAPWLAPYPPDAQLDILGLRSSPPSAAHPFGTDQFSRDLLSRVLYGARVSLSFAAASVLLGLIVGTAWGAATSLGPRLLGTTLRRMLDVALSIPRLLVLLAVPAFTGPLSFSGLIVLVGLTGWFTTARQVADELDGLAQQEFALAARAMGVSRTRLFLRHLLPFLIPLLAINATFGTANTIALEAGLSFLGLGIQPPMASWGNILHDTTGAFGVEWWIAVFPGIAIVGAVFICHLLGDALRESFAPAHVASKPPTLGVTLSGITGGARVHSPPGTARL